jgi:hypothetical protein
MDQRGFWVDTHRSPALANGSIEMKKLVAVLFTAMAMAAAPVVVAPAP